MQPADRHALVIPLYGDTTQACWDRLSAYRRHGFWVVVVNNNPSDLPDLPAHSQAVVNHHNRSGLAGGLNAGVEQAIRDGAAVVTLLDQDSLISAEALHRLAGACQGHAAPQRRVVGPCIWDRRRDQAHSHPDDRARFLITSGTTFVPEVWSHVGPLQAWMEIDYIDHEWCSRACQRGVQLQVLPDACLLQTFGRQHPNRFAHALGLQLYSTYRRAIAIRNLRWLLGQPYVPLDLRLKELIKMLLKPWIWLLLEPQPVRTLQGIWVGLTAPLLQPFPRQHLEPRP